MAKEDFNQVSSSFEAVQVYFISDIVSFDILSNCRYCNASPLFCPINATSSSSYVFRLQYLRVLYCRIVPIEKLKTLVSLERKKTPMTHLGSEYKTNYLKVTRKFSKTPRGLHAVVSSNEV